jgi:large subunit ribosomal protein L3
VIIGEEDYMNRKNFCGRKIGMTQVFARDRVIPVTVIDVFGWYVTQIKKQDVDGYNAIQIGLLRKKYANAAFSIEWLKKKKHYFEVLHEVCLPAIDESLVMGQLVNLSQYCSPGDYVHVSGMTKGCGYAGVIRRHAFTGAPASHGHTMGKKPGALSFMRSRGRVIKGKRLPGHMGNDLRMMRNLEVIKIDNEAGIIVVKGAVPGKSGSVVFVQKA